MRLKKHIFKVFNVTLLTALDGMRGHLERDVLSSGLRYVHTKHKTNTRVFPTDVRLALPQLDVGVPELQDSCTVDSARKAYICKKNRQRKRSLSGKYSEIK